MCDSKKREFPPLWRALGVVLVGLGGEGAALAQVPATEPVPTLQSSDGARAVDIQEYIVRGNTVLDGRTIELAITPFLGPDKTMKDIEGARDALLAAYQAKGYQSVYVDLPEQQVTAGIVFLQVNETRVGRVRVVGAEYNSPVEIRDQVPALREGVVPDFNQAQNELTALNRGPKRQVTPLVKQGALPGTMDVDLKVDDGNPWRASAGLNNDYSADTKKLRLSASVGYDNLWQMGHSVSLSLFATPEDLNQTKVWSGSYVAPLRGTDWSIEASGYVSDSNVATVGGTSVLGKGSSVGVKATYTVPDAGAWYHSFSGGIDFKDNKEGLRFGNTTDEVPLKYAPITLAYNGFYQADKVQYGTGLSFVAGTRSFFGYGSDALAFDYKRYKASPSFMLIKGDFNGTFTLEDNSQIGLRLNAQVTDSPLVSGEQIAAGGLNSVRGYLSAEATGDLGFIGSLEFRTKPIDYFSEQGVDAWRAYAFIDAGRLRLRDPLVEQTSRFSLASVGVGTSFRVGPSVGARFDVGYPLKAGTRTERHSPRLTFNINATY